MLNRKGLLDEAVGIAQEAGKAIMAVYKKNDLKIKTKTDNSPVTEADHAADKIIDDKLKQISDYDIISEEGSHTAQTDKFWLVDPLDGTKEFISGHGEFTVNIALVDGGKPVLGVVYAPAKDLLYAGAENLGAFKISAGKKQAIKAEYKGKIPTIVISRSHRGKDLDKFINSIGEHKEISMGSSLKLCLVAEGKAQLYPRFVPTCLWDTAAADAILRAAGGAINDFDDKELRYKPSENIMNPFFVARTSNGKI